MSADNHCGACTALAERVAFLERMSPQFRAAQAEQQRLEREQLRRSITTVAQYRKLDDRQKTAYNSVVRVDDLVKMLSKASARDRAHMLANRSPDVVARVTYALAPSESIEQLVDITATQDVQTRLVRLDVETGEALRDIGVHVREMDRHTTSDAPYLIPAQLFRVADVPQRMPKRRWDALVAHHPGIAKAFGAGWLVATPVEESEARSLALTDHLQRMAFAPRADVEPTLPEMD